MSQKRKSTIARKLMKNLSRGVVKSIPFIGALTEQLIYGTLDEQAAKKETEKLHAALSQIAERQQGQDFAPADFLNELKGQGAFREEVAAEIDGLHAVLNDPGNAAISEELADAVERMIVHNLPYRSIGGLLKGRQDMLDRLRDELGAGKTAAITQVQAIHGLGGVGKTRLSVEYAWNALEEGRHTAAFFVVADSVANMNTNLAALAGPGLLNLPEQESREQPVIVEAVLSELARRSGWLMIFDNVDSDESAARLHRDVLPRLTGGNVLITSRKSNWPDEVSDLAIDKLEETDAAAYLLEKTGSKRAKSDDDEQLAGDIARELDGLPVALEQAAAYICRRHIGLGTYLKDFGESRRKVLSWYKAELNYPVAVLAAWETTNERLGASERGILRLASFLAPEAIPAELFESKAEKVEEAAGLIREETSPRSESPVEEGDPGVRSLLAELAGWSMIALEQESFTMHRLVQDSIRLTIPKDKLKAWVSLALEVVNQYIPAAPPSNDVRSWHIWKSVDTHVRAVVSHADGEGITEPTTRLMNDLALYLKTHARFDDAEPMYRRALQIDEQALGKDHPKIATELNNLAELLRATNHTKEAEPLIRRALEIDEKYFGKDHHKVGIPLNNLAQLLHDTNRLKEAEPLMRRVAEILQNPGGEPFPNYSTALNNLALLLKETNRLDEAEPMYRRALEIDEQSFGKDHPNVARDLNNLALLLQARNRLKDAEPLMRRALEIFEKSLGPDHPNTMKVRENLEGLK